MPKVYASIVIFDTPSGILEGVLSSLLNSSVQKIFLLDNSPSSSYGVYAESEPNIIYRPIENKGFGNAHNIAINQAIKEGADFHLVVNPDVRWEGDVVKILTEYLEENPDVALVAPKVLNPDGTLQYTCRNLPSPWDLIANRFLPFRITEKRRRKFLNMDRDHNIPFDCPYLLGCFLLFRTGALKECGLFDERFFLYPEDIDITRRLHLKWKTMYLPIVSVVHHHQRASAKSFRMFVVHAINMVKYFNKWGWLGQNASKKKIGD